jgi:two-component system sensor histidine kinase BaeS
VNVWRLGLRPRLALALVGVAVLAVALAWLIGDLGLEPRLNAAAKERLQRTATHAAAVAATVYSSSSGWGAPSRQELRHLAALDGLRIAVWLPDGRLLAIGPPPTGPEGEAPVVSRGRKVGTVVVSASSGTLLTSEERHLRHSLDRLHLVAAGAAAFAALVTALLIAATLSRPLRRIRMVAERLERGELGARVELVQEPEMQAVGRALNRLAETLEHEEEVRRETVADLAHELRTPVNGLLQRIEAAQDGVLQDERANLEAMHGEALRLTRLLEDLDRLVEAQRPGLLIDKRVVDLSEIASEQAVAFQPLFAEKQIGLETSLTPAGVAGDPARLAQIVANLLSNAQRYTPSGGSVRVSVRRSDGVALLEVADTGIGIAPEDLRHIFERFWRGEKSRSRATGGAGIGLAIVSELVRAHDGRIDVESRPGAGSTFRVSLPLAME